MCSVPTMALFVHFLLFNWKSVLKQIFCSRWSLSLITHERQKSLNRGNGLISTNQPFTTQFPQVSWHPFTHWHFKANSYFVCSYPPLHGSACAGQEFVSAQSIHSIDCTCARKVNQQLVLYIEGLHIQFGLETVLLNQSHMLFFFFTLFSQIKRSTLSPCCYCLYWTCLEWVLISSTEAWIKTCVCRACTDLSEGKQLLSIGLNTQWLGVPTTHMWPQQDVNNSMQVICLELSTSQSDWGRLSGCMENIFNNLKQALLENSLSGWLSRL